MNEPQKDLVIEAREWCESSDAMLDEPMRQRLAQLCDEVERLRGGIRKTLDENGHLADGDNCTLIHLKRAIGES